MKSLMIDQDDDILIRRDTEITDDNLALGNIQCRVTSGITQPLMKTKIH
ncbi:MAG: hypothetical protein P8Q37_04695 [Porticoccaceae bacterium]|nr:hypothetical protein [Porticoccaceae bacterium]MDG1474179.1 hypothetical protein [Porticoccaceae bacterium]